MPGEALCAAHLERGCPSTSPLTGWEPDWEPNRWNSIPSITETHNCYSYAMNTQDPRQIAKCARKKRCDAATPQPGAASGQEQFKSKNPKTCPNMVTRVLGDNPHSSMTRFEAKCPTGTSKIALVVDESDDYHFLRQDSNGYWSHKPGSRAITNEDAGGHKIWNPQRCDMNYASNNEGVLNYDIFCGYFCVPRNRQLFITAYEGGARRRQRLRRQQLTKKRATRRGLRRHRA